MERTKLFDKVLNHLNDDQLNKTPYFWQLIPTCKEYFKVSDPLLIENIYDELIDREWVTHKKDGSEFSVMITHKGKKMMKEHKSYSSFKKSIDKSNNKTKNKKNLKLILKIIGTIGTISLVFLTCSNIQKETKINNQQTEIEKLNRKIDSLKIELKPKLKNDIIPLFILNPSTHTN